MLFFFDANHIELGVISFALGTLGYGGSIVFYNSFLPVIAKPEDQDRISARGYSMGYLGGVILLLFNLLMIMKPELWFEAIEAVRTPEARVILMTPSGVTFRQAEARRLARAKHLIFVCGHYEGIDERVREALVTDELSIGDYVLTNGVLPAAVVVDAVVRLLPGVLGGGEAATRDESFTEDLLECPQYTRPAIYRGMAVPEVLQSGNHAEMEAWRAGQALDRTARRRPDLLK